MLISFKEFITERFITIGFDPKKEHLRDKHRQEFHDILKKSYEKVDGGYGGLGSGSKEESNAIHADISSNIIKAKKEPEKSLRSFYISHNLDVKRLRSAQMVRPLANPILKRFHRKIIIKSEHGANFLECLK